MPRTSKLSPRSLAATLAAVIATAALHATSVPSAVAAPARTARSTAERGATARAPTRERRRRAIRKGLELSRSLALDRVLLPHYRAKNQRWGFLHARRDTERGMRAAEASARRYTRDLVARGVLERSEAQALLHRMSQVLDDAHSATREARFPDRLALEPGSRHWWSWMAQATQLRPQHSETGQLQLLVDGPRWRRETHAIVDDAEDYLHIASWMWKDDRAGRDLANGLMARKLGLTPKALRRMRRTASIKRIRDHQLTRALVNQRGLSRPAAEAQLARMSERDKRALVGELLEPLEVRVILTGVMQRLQQLAKPLGGLLRQLQQSGVQVVLNHKLLQRRFPFVRPGHLWAAVSHAKMFITRDRALVGGLNIGDEYMQPQGEKLKWHDLALRLRGNAVDDLNRSFIHHFNSSVERGATRHAAIDVRRSRGGKPMYFRGRSERDAEPALVVGTDAKVRDKRTRYTHRTALLAALASARQSFVLMGPYLTSPLLVKQLIRTARRFEAEGKDPSKIVVLVPKSSDGWLVTGNFVNNHLMQKLTRAGITVRRWAPASDPAGRGAKTYEADAFMHGKVWMVDDKAVYVGSGNNTVRSLVQDWEIGLLSGDPQLLRRMKRLVERNLRQSEPIPALPAFKRYTGHLLGILLGPLLRAL